MTISRRLPRFLATICLAASLAACNSAASSFPPVPTLCATIHHPEPSLTVQREPFLRDGCQIDSHGSSAQCASDSPVARAGCRAVSFEDWLGGLAPHDALAACAGAAKSTTSATYIVYRDGAYQLLSTPEQVRAWYAPIESEDEALSYAAAMTGYRPKYGLNICNGIYMDYKPLVKEIEDSHVERLENGYRVYLFSDEGFDIESIVLDVTKDGTVTLHSRQRIAEMF